MHRRRGGREPDYDRRLGRDAARPGAAPTASIVSTMNPLAFPRASGRAVLAGLLVLALAGCGTQTRMARSVYQNEHFSADETFSRMLDADAATACEAARLALLSQGYVVSTASREAVTANKRFQPDGELHVQISFTVTCAAEPGDPSLAMVFVNAVQDRYTLKKAQSSASVGLPVGSFSIPLSASDDSLVRVGSETIPAGSFYDRFFVLLQRYAASLACGAGPERSACLADRIPPPD